MLGRPPEGRIPKVFRTDAQTPQRGESTIQPLKKQQPIDTTERNLKICLQTDGECVQTASPQEQLSISKIKDRSVTLIINTIKKYLAVLWLGIHTCKRLRDCFDTKLHLRLMTLVNVQMRTSIPSASEGQKHHVSLSAMSPFHSPPRFSPSASLLISQHVLLLLSCPLLWAQPSPRGSFPAFPYHW